VLALVTAIAGGCGGHRSTTVDEGVVPGTTVPVFLATALPCEDLGTASAHFTPLVVRGPGYATTIEPSDACRKQSSGRSTNGVAASGHWYSYRYDVPMPPTGTVRLTPGNQPTATLDASKVWASNAATIYYVNCRDYDADCPAGGRFHGRISPAEPGMQAIEYFKDDDVGDAP
jgi:hypothetical protein